MSTTTVIFTMKDVNGNIIPFSTFQIESGRANTGYIPDLIPASTTFVTDASGQASVDLVVTTAPYYISAINNGTEHMISYKFFVPASQEPINAELLYVDLNSNFPYYNDKHMAALVEAKIAVINARNQVMTGLNGDIPGGGAILNASQINFSPVAGPVNNVFQEITKNNKYLVLVETFGATGNGITDDRAAIQAAIDHVYNLGGGEVILKQNGVHLINSGDLIIKSRVSLVGHAHMPGEVVPRPRYYNAVPNSIVLHPDYTINIATEFEHHNAGLRNVYICNPLVDTNKYSATYTYENRAELGFLRTNGQPSLAIKVGNVLTVGGVNYGQGNNNCFVKEVCVIGYSQLLWADYANGFEYGGIRGDCTNGIRITNITHIARNFAPCDLFPYVTVNRGNAGKYNWRNGVGYDLDYQGAYLENSFSYGHKIGFRLRRDTAVLNSCWADANPESTIDMATLWGDVSHGFLSENGNVATGSGNPAIDHQLIGCGSSSHTYGFTSAIGATGALGRKLTLTSCSAWGSNGNNHLYVETGIVIARNCNFFNKTKDTSNTVIRIADGVTYYDIQDCTFHQPAGYLPVAFGALAYEKGCWGRGNKVFNGLGPATHETTADAGGQDDHSYVVIGNNSGMKLNGKYANGNTATKTAPVNNTPLFSTAGWGYSGVTYVSAGRHSISIDDPSPSTTSMGGKHIFSTTPAGSTTMVDRIEITNLGHLIPVANNTYDFGAATLRWKGVYANKLLLYGLPSSPDGLPEGSVWRDGDVLKVKYPGMV